MSRFHPLEVTDIHPETRDSVVVTLRPRPEDARNFDFTQGQYLTFRREFDGEELRRSYSICTGLDEGCLKIGIKRVEGGTFSTWANEELKIGDVLEAMSPMGKFFAPIDPTVPKSYLGFAGGSGITPLLSIIKTILAREPQSSFTLVYANKQVGSIMFREELEDLKNIYLERFALVHILATESQDIGLFTGRIDAEKIDGLFRLWVDVENIDTAFICGPESMMLVIADSLRRHGLLDGQIKFELFVSSQPGRATARARSKQTVNSGSICDVSVTLDGTTRNFKMPKDGTPILNAALNNAMDAPFACKAGVCSTCRAKVLEGEVEMAANHALEDYEVRAGYVLSCQSIPLSDKVVISYDE